ncbi:MAG: flagellar basal-body MS-ring/collar protein FliF, partial [Candidatus Cloacimonadota bacterium]|nr:flagellar basal-body MS-ring/collar protein FliF [Candidatus Cloacimonadota bacterium]
MNEFLKKITNQFKEIYSRLNTRQKIFIASLFVLTIVSFVWLISWSSRVEYNLLFGSMDNKEANLAIEKLKELKIEYKLKDSGRSIFIPADRIYETRIVLSSEGIGTNSEIGYEIFDKSTLGLTEFVLEKNYIRAIQGELKRTIEIISGIEYARVHIVIPEEAIFKEDQKETTASVMLQTNSSLQKKQIVGITNLIASAVEGLSSGNIVVTDQNANLLTDNLESGMFGSSNFHSKIKQQIENSLWTKTQTMLDNILGENNSVVRISADLNFDEIDTTLEEYDPESRVARSEQIESESTTNEIDSTSTSSERLINNYEINKTIRHIKNQVGTIKRLTVSVSVNFEKKVTEIDGKSTVEYLPRTVDELDSIENLVKNSVGYDIDRNDDIVVATNHFEETYQTKMDLQEEDRKRREMIDLGIKLIIVIILIVLVYSLTRQFRQIFATQQEDEFEEAVRPALAEGTAASEGFYPEGEEGMPMGEGKISFENRPMEDIKIEQTASQALQVKITKFIEENAETSLHLINSWLLEEDLGNE